MQRTQDKSAYARRRNEAYWGTPIDDNAVYAGLDKSNAQVIYQQFLTVDSLAPRDILTRFLNKIREQHFIYKASCTCHSNVVK